MDYYITHTKFDGYTYMGVTGAFGVRYVYLEAFPADWEL